MESRRSSRPLLAAVLALSSLLLVLLLQPVSAAPVSRSLALVSQQRPPAVKLSSQGVTAAARMDVEVNDYPGTGPNDRHNPPNIPGRA